MKLEIFESHEDFPVGDVVPLGATYYPEESSVAVYYGKSGTNFAVYAPEASLVKLCLYDESEDTLFEKQIPMHQNNRGVWTVFVPEVGIGAKYLFRALGEFSPQTGLRFNPSKVLLDPWSRGVTGPVPHCEAIFGYPWSDSPDRDLTCSVVDSALVMPKCVVMPPMESITWERPYIPDEEALVYETHVEAATRLFPGIPEEIRGTYRGLSHPLYIAHLKSLRVNRLQLLPVQYFAQPGHLLDRGLQDFWGYNTLLFFVPHHYGTTSDPIALLKEVREVVQILAENGIEVFLDVVYNHTFEGNQDGPTLCYKGLANRQYYYLESGGRYYKNWTGTGNVLAMRNPVVEQLMVDSLTYWYKYIGVGGFRFDLAAALTRGPDGHMDPSALRKLPHNRALEGATLITESWDAHGGYLLGQLDGFMEWNGALRDGLKRVIKGDGIVNIVDALSGSPSLFRGRGTRASQNILFYHDGNPLADAARYNQRHNEANHEGNRDGDPHSLSWNCGVEGTTDDPDINRLRQRQYRNYMTLFFLCPGVPLIRGGDEVLQSYYGNNNTYCQRNLGIIRWDDLLAHDYRRNFYEYFKKLIEFRFTRPLLCKRHFLHNGLDIRWIDGERPGLRIGAVLINGSAKTEAIRKTGETMTAASLLILMNFYTAPYTFQIPSYLGNVERAMWKTVINTEFERWGEDDRVFSTGSAVVQPSYSIQVLEMVTA
jgi:isoamylase